MINDIVFEYIPSSNFSLQKSQDVIPYQKSLFLKYNI